MKRIVRFGKRKFVCELKKVLVSGGKNTTEKVFCREVRKYPKKNKSNLT